MRDDWRKAEKVAGECEGEQVDQSEVIVISGLMKLISYERKMIKKILDHLGLPEEAKSKRKRARPHQNFAETIIEPYEDGWPDYEKPFVDVGLLWLAESKWIRRWLERQGSWQEPSGWTKKIL